MYLLLFTKSICLLRLELNCLRDQRTATRPLLTELNPYKPGVLFMGHRQTE